MSDLFVRSASLEGYVQLTESLAGDASALLQAANIPMAWLSDNDTLIPAESMTQLLEQSADALHCPDFGLRLARLQTLGMLGPVGLLVQQCVNFGEALLEIKRFIHVHSQAGNIDYQVSDNTVFISYEPLVSFHGRNRQLVELSLAAGFTILASLVSQPLKLVSAYFAHDEPEHLDAHHAFFACPLVFNSESNGVVISRQSLSIPLKSEKDRLKSFMNRYLERLEQQQLHSVVDRVRLLIRQSLPLGTSNIDQISRLLGVDKRTLQRRLKEQNLRFQTLLDEEREALAIRYLNETNVTLTHLTDLLGFADLAVFSRRFKVWTGQSPTEFLKSQSRRLRYK